MTDRSVRVILAADSGPFMASMRAATESVTTFARAGVSARGTFADISVSVGQLRVKVDELGRVQGITNVTRDLEKMKAAISGMSGLSDLSRLTKSLRDLSVGGADLTIAVENIKKLAPAVRSMASAVGSSTGLKEFITALHGLSSFSGAGAGEELKNMSTAIRRLIKDANSVPAIRALATALRDLGAAGGGLGGLGNFGNSLRGMQSQIDQLQRSITRLRASGGGSGGSGGSGSSGGVLGNGMVGNFLKYSVGTAAVGAFGVALKSTIKQTSDFETEILTLGAITKTSGTAVMAQASAKALQLGADFTIAGASASDAAVTMQELAKGGLSVQDSMTAAKGSLQLASAGQVGFAQAAEIMTSALAAFQLPAKQAGMVTDVLANTANAARGNINDFATGLTYAGTTAHQVGYNIQQTSTILALFAQNGQTGSVGGTTFAEMLLKLEKPSAGAQKALERLGISVYDANGNFITARNLADELSKAKARMSLQDYNAAAATVFGARAIRGATILAQEGTAGYDKMSKAINDGAGAAAFSAARMQGLGGAFANLQNQVQTAQVTLGEKFSPRLQQVLNDVSAAVPVVTGFLTGASLGGGLSKIGTWFDPLVAGAGRLISVAWPYIQNFVESVGRGFESVISFIKPVADGFGSFFKSLANGGTISLFGSALDALGSGFQHLMQFLVPVGSVIGSVVSFMGKIPEPIYMGVAALGAFLLLRGPMNAMFLQLITGYARLGVAITGGGIIAGARALGASLLSALGGPLGLAITAATIGLGFFLGRTKDATNATKDFSDAIDANTGKLNDQANINLATKLKGSIANYLALGGAVGDYTAAVEGNIPAQQRVATVMQAASAAAIAGSDNWKHFSNDYAKAGITSDMVATALAKGGTALSDLKQKYSAAGLATTVGDFSTGLGNLGGSLSHVSDVQKDYGTDVATLGSQLADSKRAADDASTAQKLLAASTDDGADSGKRSFAAFQAQATQMDKTAGAVVNYHSKLQSATFDTEAFYTAVAGAKAGDPTTYITPMSNAFTAYKDAVTAADTETNLFIFTMDKLAGRNVPVQDAMAADAAAMRGIGAAYRAQVQNQLDLAKAQQAVTDAQKNIGATNKDGTPSSSATTQADVVAAQLKLADANDKVAGSVDAITAAETAAQKTAALRVAQVATAANATGGYGAALKAATAQMGVERQAFIDQAEASGLSAVAAGKLADSFGLVTTAAGVKAILNADPTLAVEAAARAKKAYDDATKDRTTKFNTSTHDALLDIATFGSDISKIPKIYQTSFKADVATAKADGQNLYQVYDKTTGNWVAQFLTPTAAAAQTAAGNLVNQYDAARGTWTANLVAEDNASKAISYVQSVLDGIKDKTVNLRINALGIAAPTLDANGTLRSGSGAILKANGGYISGPGGPREDKIPAMLSNGEFVMNAASTAKNLPLLHAMNNKYADGGVVGRINMSATGDISGATAAMAAIYANLDKSAAALMAVAQAATVVPTSSAAGVEQWRALASSVFASKGVPQQYVQTLLNQMNQESSGNPAAINLTDINAQNGHPSVGLLQFIPSTFAAFADPGFNTNIYDPASQFHAFINYINGNYGGMAAFTAKQSANGWGAYANGGYVSGPGSSRSDSIPAHLSNGEFVVNAAATSQNLGLLHAINGYANGGLVLPSTQALTGFTGIAPPGSGPRLTEVITALQLISVQVAKQDAALVTARTAAQKATAAADAAAVAATVAEKRAQAQYSAAQLKAGATSNAKIEAAQASLNRVQASGAASQLAAENRLQAAHEARGKNHDAVVEAAQQRLAAVQLANADKVAAAEKKLGDVRKAESSKVQVSQAALIAAHAKVAAAADKARIAQAGYESVLDRTQAIDKVQAAYQRQYHTQEALAAQLDTLDARQAAAQSNLVAQQANRASLVQSTQASFTSFDGGLTGHPQTRNTFATILQGQQYDEQKASTFRSQLETLRKKGLSASSISQIAAAGIDGGGVTATALASATPAQLKQLNTVTQSIGQFGLVAGNTVGDSMYGAGISISQGLIKGITSQEKAIRAAMLKIANSIVGSFKGALKINSPSQVFHEFGGHITSGLENGINAGGPRVNAAIGNLVQMPNIPRQSYQSSVPPTIDLGGIRVFVGDKEMTDIARVEVENGFVQFGRSVTKVGMQS